MVGLKEGCVATVHDEGMGEVEGWIAVSVCAAIVLAEALKPGGVSCCEKRGLTWLEPAWKKIRSGRQCGGGLPEDEP